MRGSFRPRTRNSKGSTPLSTNTGSVGHLVASERVEGRPRVSGLRQLGLGHSSWKAWPNDDRFACLACPGR